MASGRRRTTSSMTRPAFAATGPSPRHAVTRASAPARSTPTGDGAHPSTRRAASGTSRRPWTTGSRGGDGTAGPGLQVYRFFPSNETATATDPTSTTLLGEDSTTGVSGSCGSSRVVFITMPFKLVKTSLTGQLFQLSGQLQHPDPAMESIAGFLGSGGEEVLPRLVTGARHQVRLPVHLAVRCGVPPRARVVGGNRDRWTTGSACAERTRRHCRRDPRPAEPQPLAQALAEPRLAGASRRSLARCARQPAAVACPRWDRG